MIYLLAIVVAGFLLYCNAYLILIECKLFYLLQQLCFYITYAVFICTSKSYQEYFEKLKSELLMIEREKERSSFLNPVLSALTQVAGFISCPSIVRKHHHATSLCRWHPPF